MKLSSCLAEESCSSAGLQVKQHIASASMWGSLTGALEFLLPAATPAQASGPNAAAAGHENIIVSSARQSLNRMDCRLEECAYIQSADKWRAVLQAAFHTSIAKWIVLNSKRAVTVLNPYRLGHHKGVAKNTHPAHAK